MSSARDPDALAEPGTPLPGDLLAPADVATTRVDVDAGPPTNQSAPDRAKDAAGEVAQTTVDKTREVAGEAKTQVRSVVEETKSQVSGLFDQAKTELRSQAADRGSQAASSLRTLSDRVGALQSGRPQDAGPLVDYLREAQVRVSGLADRLDEHGLEGALDDVASFARRRPGLFLLGAAGAGFVIGRFVRSGARAVKSDSPSSESRSSDGYSSAIPHDGELAALSPASQLAP